MATVAQQERSLQYKGAERDLGGADVEALQPSSAQAPRPVDPSMLPQEQPLCPRCSSGLYPMRQNGQGDTLFECLKCATEGDGYQAIFRLNPPRWERHPQHKGAFSPPVRQKDLDAIAKGEKQADPAVRPAVAWPEETVAANKAVRRPRRAKAAGGTDTP